MRLLVACTANIARSPLAAAILTSGLMDAGVEVVTAGTRARKGYPAAEATQTLACDRGLDVSAHRSRPITDGLVRKADLVLTMSERQRDHCAPLATGAATHVFTLREIDRLLEAVDVDAGPAGPSERLRWLADQAHLARPRARPPRGREDIADPIREPWPAWEAMGASLDELLGRLLAACGR